MYTLNGTEYGSYNDYYKAANGIDQPTAGSAIAGSALALDASPSAEATRNADAFARGWARNIENGEA